MTVTNATFTTQWARSGKSKYAYAPNSVPISQFLPLLVAQCNAYNGMYSKDEYTLWNTHNEIQIMKGI